MEVRNRMVADRESFESEEDYLASVEAITADIDDIKHHLIDSNRIVRKGTEGTTIQTNA